MEQNLKEKKHKYKDINEMLEKNKFLVSIETVKIKDFIFNTNKLKTIRGASYLLDYMNQVEVPRVLEKYGIIFDNKELSETVYSISDTDFIEKVNEKINEFVSLEIIYIGAGNAKFFVENEEIAKEICKEIKSGCTLHFGQTTVSLLPQRNSQSKSAERSEERRVGKECRSRWSPYH